MIKVAENNKITEILTLAIRNYPDLRFNQILHGLNIVASEGDSFYDEPNEVLERIQKSALYKKLHEPKTYKGVF